MNNLIICTTAIIRGDYHKKSIGTLYEKFNNIFQKYNVYHIINIDKPPKLLQQYSVEQTVSLFDSIIPDNINKIYIKSETPSFLIAFKNIMNKIDELKLESLTNKTLVWWLEDDWDSKVDYNFLKIADLLDIPNSAFTYTLNAHLGSFRGGPIMSLSYFQNYFNIEKKKVMNSTCDPERQVSRWISGINRVNGNQRIHRDITDNNSINIVFMYLLDYMKETDINLNEIPNWYYNREAKYNKDLTFNYYLIVADNENMTNLSYSKINIEHKSYATEKQKLKKVSIVDLKTHFNNNSITYFSIRPDIFYDVGRHFNSDHQLEKWETINDSATYKN